MAIKRYLLSILLWNRKLFPVFVIILMAFVAIKSIYPGIPSRWLNLDYKIAFILASGLLVLIDVHLNKK